MRLPKEVNLRGTGYRVAEHEGLIVFTESMPVWGGQDKITFDLREGIWYVSTEGRSIPAEQVVQALEQVKQCYGANFKARLGPDGLYVEQP